MLARGGAYQQRDDEQHHGLAENNQQNRTGNPDFHRLAQYRGHDRQRPDSDSRDDHQRHGEHQLTGLGRNQRFLPAEKRQGEQLKYRGCTEYSGQRLQPAFWNSLDLEGYPDDSAEQEDLAPRQ